MDLKFIKIQDPSLWNHIESGLDYNVNHWKRVGAERDFTAADKHFYEEIFSAKIMKQIGEIMGVKFPAWGTVVNNFEIGGEHCPVGLRWGHGHSAFSVSGERKIGGPQVKNVLKILRTSAKGANGKRLIPQIAVTVRPDEVYDTIFNDPLKKYLVRSGGKGKDTYKPSSILHDCDFWNAKSTKICVLRFTLPFLPSFMMSSSAHGHPFDPVSTVESVYFMDEARTKGISDETRDRVRMLCSIFKEK